MQKIIIIIFLLGISGYSNAQEVSKNRVKTSGLFKKVIHDYTINAFLKLDAQEDKSINTTGSFYAAFQVSNNQIKRLTFFHGGLDFFRSSAEKALLSIPEDKLRELNSLNDEFYILPIHYDFSTIESEKDMIERKIKEFRNLPLPTTIPLSFDEEFRKIFNIEDPNIDGVRVIFLSPLRIIKPHYHIE